MPPPPVKILKQVTDNDQQIEQLLIDGGYFETLEVYRAERNKRARVPSEHGDNVHAIEKKGDLWCCTFCEKTFTTKGSAKRHLVSTHTSDSKQFECPRCTSKFARRDDLYTHLRRMHAASQLVEEMIEEHKAELKGEHKGSGKGQLLNVISHNEHLDVVLPSGNTICRPFSTDVSSAVAKEPSRAAKACRGSKCNHWRITHDDHEDILVNGALHHKNEEGEWECHGEIGSMEDFEFLLSTARAVEENCALIPFGNAHGHTHDAMSHASGHLHHDDHDHELSFDDFDFFLGTGEPVVPAKQTVESLLLPGGSVLCRRISSATPRYHYLPPWTGEEHKHSLNCGHSRMRHGNHYDYVVGNVMESDNHDCPINGTVVLEGSDSTTLSQVVTALAQEQSQQEEALAAPVPGAPAI